jgi:hypothetical protein
MLGGADKGSSHKLCEDRLDTADYSERRAQTFFAGTYDFCPLIKTFFKKALVFVI